MISAIFQRKIILSDTDEIWDEVALEDVADGFEYGMNVAAMPYDGLHKYIRITDIDENSHKYFGTDPVSPSGNLDDKFRVLPGDILFALTGASVGKSYLYRSCDGEMYFAGFLIRIRVKSGYDSEYVFINTLTDNYDKWVMLESARSGQPGINAEQYRKYRFRLPSLSTQRKISHIISTIDNVISKNGEILVSLQKQKQGLMQLLFI